MYELNWKVLANACISLILKTILGLSAVKGLSGSSLFNADIQGDSDVGSLARWWSKLPSFQGARQSDPRLPLVTTQLIIKPLPP